MCKNLFKLSKIFLDTELEEMAQAMISRMQQRMMEHPESHANWLHLTLFHQYPFYEVAVVGEAAMEKSKELQGHYLPNAVFAGTDQQGSIDLLQNRYVKDKTLIYVCSNGSCKLPFESAPETIQQLIGNK